MEVFDLLIKKVIEELKREVGLVEGYSFNLSNSIKSFDEYDEVKLMKKL